MQLSQRQKDILSAIVELYSATGYPVGSKMVCEALNGSCSSATVRNDMVELINLGLLIQPHTSAGRVPSVLGYRYYVSQLMKQYPLDENDKQHIDSMLPVFTGDPDKYIEKTGEVLADLTNCTCVNIAPVDSNAFLKRIEIIPMSSSVFMVAVLSSSGIMKSRVCHSDFSVSDQTVQTVTTLLNNRFSGQSLSSISPALIQSAVAESNADIFLLGSIIESFWGAVNDLLIAKMMMDGQSNLFNYFGDFSAETIRGLFEFLSNKDEIFSLFKNTKSNLSVVIGDDSVSPALRDISIISSNYDLGNSAVGKIGIIGPVRLDYCHIIPSVEYVAQSLKKQFKDWSVSIG